MATFIPNISDVIPMPLLYQPNFEFILQSGLLAKQQYQASLDKINEIYGIYARSPILDERIDKRRNEYINSINEYIDKFKTLDLRDPAIITAFTDIFKPLARDVPVMHGIMFASSYEKEKSFQSLLRTQSIVGRKDAEGKDSYAVYDADLDRYVDSMVEVYKRLDINNPLKYKLSIPTNLIGFNVARYKYDLLVNFLDKTKGAGDSKVYIIDALTGQSIPSDNLNGEQINHIVSLSSTASGNSVMQYQQAGVGTTPDGSGSSTTGEAQTSVVSRAGSATVTSQSLTGFASYVVSERGGERQVLPLNMLIEDAINKDPRVQDYYRMKSEAYMINTLVDANFDPAMAMNIVIKDLNNKRELLASYINKYNNVSFMSEKMKKDIKDRVDATIGGYMGIYSMANFINSGIINSIVSMEYIDMLSKHAAGNIKVMEEYIKNIDDIKNMVNSGVVPINIESYITNYKNIASLRSNIESMLDGIMTAEAYSLNIYHKTTQSLGSNIGAIRGPQASLPSMGGAGSRASSPQLPVYNTITLPKLDSSGNIDIKDTQGIKVDYVSYNPAYIDNPDKYAEQQVRDAIKKAYGQKYDIRDISSLPAYDDIKRRITAKGVFSTYSDQLLNNSVLYSSFGTPGSKPGTSTSMNVVVENDTDARGNIIKDRKTVYIVVNSFTITGNKLPANKPMIFQVIRK